jgi:hypothetical protein
MKKGVGVKSGINRLVLQRAICAENLVKSVEAIFCEKSKTIQILVLR